MKTQLFIPTKICAGFQARKDTYTQKLAYIIYYDNKGKIRKEKSWENWRDKTIEAVEFDNVPTDGFTLNKDIKRYNGEWAADIKTRINQLALKKKRDELAKLEARVNALVSQEQRRELELKKLAEELS